jgi:hypothetical protein
MRTFSFSDRRVINTVAAIGILVGAALPAFVPAFASAQEITTRSIDLSDSTTGATGVNYDLTFTPVATVAAGFVIDFCSNTPLVGDSCTAPSGLSTTGIATTTTGYTATDLSSHSGAIVTKDTGTFAGGTPLNIVLTGITNPSAPAGTFYARIVTYTTNTDLTSSPPTDNTTLTTGNEDSGGVALSTTSGFGVSGAVLESMTFCVSGTDTSVATDVNCVNTGSTLTTPNLNLGTDDGGTYVLSNNEASPSTGTVYTQLSTNAVGGAVVNIKSDASQCGGLVNTEDSSDCIPALASGFTSGAAGFGVETGASSASATSGDSNATGVIDPATGYTDSSYFLDFTSGATPSTGDTSAYGTPILNTDGAPVNDMNMPLIFAAASNNNTPAGEYAAQENLIATGIF